MTRATDTMIKPDTDDTLAATTVSDLAQATIKSPIYPLNTSDPGNPELFLISGLSGQVFPFKRCARMMSAKLQVTGLLFPHLVGDTSRYRTIKDTADFFHDIVAASDRNCVIVFGFSKGGAIAFELTKRLTEEGHQVGLILFDTSVRHLQTKANPAMFMAKDLARSVSRGFERLKAFRSGELAHHARLDSIFAMQKFRPQPSEVPTVLLRPRMRKKPTRYVPTLDLGWGNVCNLLTILETDGTHVDAFKGSYAPEFCSALVEGARIIQDHMLQTAKYQKGADQKVAAP